MNNRIRTRAAFLLLTAALGGCGTVDPLVSSARRVVSAVLPSSASAAVAPPSRTLDAYKTEVARHVMRHNSERTFSGRLPPMLPAIVVVNITVDADGELQNLVVQRSRDPDASSVALSSLRRSGPLPKPAALLAAHRRALTFSETFLFDDQYRFQLRSVAGPQ